MLTTLPNNNRISRYATDRIARSFIILSLSYLVLAVLFGTIGSFQYVLPDFLKNSFGFQKTRPLHVYLVTSWIFTAAQGIMYYFIPRVAQRSLVWHQGPLVHFFAQAIISFSIVTGFFLGNFGGREYLEFPPFYAILIALSWLPLAINYFATVKPDFRTAPVYIWSWSAGIVFFFITLGESYMWTFDHVMANTTRDITIQWKALGSMVGSWNMLIYGSALYLMTRISGNQKIARSPLSFFFFFVGFTNLMFNWGHHTYSVPASGWIRTISYVISMTELLLFGQIILKFRKTLSQALRKQQHLTNRLLFSADVWIFFNLALAITISVPAINAFTHGTHITVAHAMGATIGINTMLLLASVVYIAKRYKPAVFQNGNRIIAAGITVTNISLGVFLVSLIASGIIKMQGTIANTSFAIIMERSATVFKWFAASGLFILAGLMMIAISLIRILWSRRRIARTWKVENEVIKQKSQSLTSV
jgi:nitric oxide reductase subunit B